MELSYTYVTRLTLVSFKYVIYFMLHSAFHFHVLGLLNNKYCTLCFAVVMVIKFINVRVVLNCGY